MKVGFASDYFPPFAPGGAEWSVYYLARDLARAVEVVVMTPNYGAAVVATEGGFVVDRFAYPLKLAPGRALVPYGALANPLFYFYSAVQLARRVRRYRLDLLHVHHKQMLVGAVLAGRLTGVPVVASLRDLMILCRYGMCLNRFDRQPAGCDRRTYRRCLQEYVALYEPELGPAGRLARRITAAYHRVDSNLKRAALNRAAAVVTISDKLRAIYASRGITPERMVTIYNPGTNLARVAPTFRPPGDSIELLFAGKLSWGKGAHLLLEALPAIRAAMRPLTVRLTLAGEGPLRQYLVGRAGELGISGAVNLPGQLPHDELQGRYATAALVLMPSIVHEGFGRVALEALLAGTPVVASSHGGLPEIVADGVTGYVVEPTVEAFAAAAVRALQSPGLRQQVQRALPALRQKFGQDVTARYLRLYEAVLSGRAPQDQESLV